MSSPTEKIAEAVEALSVKVVMVEDDGSPSELEDILACFNQVTSAAQEAGLERIETTSKAGAGLTAGLMAGVEFEGASLDSIAKIVNTLQEMARCADDSSALDAVPLPGIVEQICGGGSSNSTEKKKEAPSPKAKPSVEAVEESEDDDGDLNIDAACISDGDAELLGEFISEGTDHLDNAEKSMLSLEEDPENEEHINAIFRAFHTIKGVAGFLNLVGIQKLSHQAETLLDMGRKGDIQLTGGRVDVIFDAIDALKTLLGDIQAILNGDPPKGCTGLRELIGRLKGCEVSDEDSVADIAPDAKLGEILVAEGVASEETVTEALEEQKSSDEQKPLGEILVEKGAAKPKEVGQALRSQAKARKTETTKDEGSVRVPTGRLDNLINMVGELVIAQAMVSQDDEIITLDSQRIERNMSHLSKITRDLQELSMAMRMVPIDGTFQKMARLVRDLAKKENKQIKFTISGEDTELDRNLVEVIHDPLVHMVRNAADHGVECPEERRKAGKSDEGSVSLKAYHLGGHIVIEIKDDGKGLDTEALLAKAVERGVVGPQQELTDEEIYALVFHPGLTTAKKVTDVSGRGVGMDVVRKNIEQLRGRVDIQSTKGKGSTFTISVPLTLAIIDGMVVRVGAERLIVPLFSITESFQPSDDQVNTVQGRGELVNIRDRLLPLSRFYSLFDIDPDTTDPTEAIILVVAEGGRERCVMVDEILGQQQVVIKSLGESLQGIPGVSGGTILGDGRVALIIDVPSLMDLSTDKVGTVN